MVLKVSKIVGSAVGARGINSALPVVGNSRFVRVRNSNSLKRVFKASSSRGERTRSSHVTWMGTSRMIVASSLERRAWSEWVSTFSFCLPLSLAALAMRFSIEPNSAMSFFAVFSPMPGIPGMLSAASPQSPRMSMTCSARSISQFASMSGRSITSWSDPLRPGFHMQVDSEMSCAKSLSGVTMNDSNPSRSARFTSVPMMSSASKPSNTNTGMWKARHRSFTCGIAAASSSGISSRCAL